MLSKAEVQRVIDLAGRGHHRVITPPEKGELRQLLARMSPQAQDLSWPDLLDSALVFIGMYTVAEMATADAS